MVELEDISGVGPARSESMQEEEYESVEAVAEADHEELADKIGVSEDKALEFVVGAQNLIGEDDEVEEEEADDFDLKPKDVSDEVEVEEVEEEDEVEDEEEEPDELVEVYDIGLDFESKRQYDTFHAALMRRHERVYTSSQPSADALDMFLQKLDSFDGVTYEELTEREVNELHSTVRQMRTRYQGDNLIDHMEALREVEEQLNDQRNEWLFA